MKLEVLVPGGTFRSPPYVMAPYASICVLRNSKHIVLIEPGGLPSWEALERALDERKIHPADITDIILSHVHMDHVFCSIFFDRATVYVHEKYAEKDYSSFGSIAGKFYEMVLSSWKRICTLKGGELLFNCVKVIHTPWHSSEHLSFVVDTENMGKVFMPGDICLSKIHFFEMIKGYRNDEASQFVRTTAKACDYIVFSHDDVMKL